MNVTLRQLHALREVAATRNFTAAAKRLHTTQSALSASVGQLEAALGVRLIARTTRRFTLTAAGEEFLPAVSRILADLDSSIKNLATLASLKRGSVCIACPPAMAAALLPGPIAVFRQCYPQVDLVLKDAASGPSLAKLKTGEVEIAIGALAHPDPEIESTPYVKDTLIALAATRYPVADRRSVSWRGLRDYPIVAPSRESSTREMIERTYEAATGKPFLPVFETSYWITTLAMVEAGLGVAVAPSHAVAHLAAKGVRVIRLTHPTVTRDIGIMTHRERMLSPAARAFVDLLIEHRRQ